MNRVNEHRQKIEKKDEGYLKLVENALKSKHQIRCGMKQDQELYLERKSL
jgi:hypothetical protein